jgi:predicted nuclease of predicted toxin-antitoxin system
VVLTGEGDTAQHVYEVIGAGASDHEVMRHAIDRGAVIITADTDFGALLMQGGSTEPSVILVRELL